MPRRRDKSIHNWGPWEEKTYGNGAVTWSRYFARECLDCGGWQTAGDRYLCDVR